VAVSAFAGAFEIEGLLACAPIATRSIVHVSAAPGRDADLATVISGTLKITLPDTPRFEVGPGLALAWIGPRRWLALTEDLPPHAFAAGLSRLVGATASVVDVSDAYVVVRLSGPVAAEVLTHMVPVDLHVSVMGVGRLAMTHAHHVAVVVFQVDVDAFELLVPRTFAASVIGWLQEMTEKYRDL
jgi:sarcosine oxidase subunit gamma